jgi:hypothetical protein
VEAALAAEIQQLRGSAEVGLAMGSEGRLFVGTGLGWTVLTETSRAPSSRAWDEPRGSGLCAH